MRCSRSLWILTPLALLLLTAMACNEAGGDAVLGPSTAESEQEGIKVNAEPAEIVLDPNDPEAPRDPQTDKLIGSAALSAIVRDALGEPTPDVEVVFASTGGALESEGNPVTTDEGGKAADTLNVTEDDAGEIEVTATSGDFTDTIVVTVTVVPLNNPPVADAGEDQTVDCPDPVMLDGSGSSDPDSTEGTNDDIVSFEWYLGDEMIAEGETAEVELPLGEHVITLKVTDKAGATDTDDVTITVQDVTPPVVTLVVDPPYLWPPNHKMRDVRAMIEVVEGCDPSPTIELVSITSNEPDNGKGDGNTSGDIHGAEFGTADMEFQLRAERAGGGSGRTYTIVYKVTDASGNETMAETFVHVPHDRRAH